MEENNNIIQFGAADIERYHKGLMNAKEMHAMEKAAMDDPFLADALEGFQVPGVNISSDLNELKNRLNERTEERKLIVPLKKSPYYFLRIAAMIVVVAGAGWLAYTFVNKNDDEIAKNNSTQNVSEKNNLTDTTVKLNNQIADSLQDIPGFKKVDGIKTEVKTATVPSYNSDTAKINVELANTTRNTGETVSNAIAIPPTAVQVPSIKTESDARKKQLAEAGVLDKKEKAAVSEEFKKDIPAAQKESNDAEFRTSNDKFSKQRQLAKSIPAPAGKFEDFSYKKDTTNYSRLNIFKGRVTDGFNNGIPFANVTISDVNVGTYADARGYFNLVAPDTTLNVSLRAVGFNNSQIQLRNSLPTNEVVLQEDRSLNAIVMNSNKPNASRSRSSRMVLTEPEPTDGWENYDSYLANNLVVPEESERQQKKGEVEVAFEVNSKGEPVNIKVTKSLCKECDEEAIRLVKDGPRWKRKSKKEKARVTIAF